MRVDIQWHGDRYTLTHYFFLIFFLSWLLSDAKDFLKNG